MIPKIINYCWFGSNPLPELAIKCIESWKKYLPDYEIKEWNESNFDVNCCDYVREAYGAKKWAFVSDYARFWIIYNYGGIYFDTDVEVIKNLDQIIDQGPFLGTERIKNIVLGLGFAANPGLGFAANPGLGLYKEILDFYNSIHFINLDGSLNDTTIVKYTTDILMQHGFKGNGKIEQVEDIYIYPPEYFCPMDYETGEVKITSYTVTIHHYSASWIGGLNRLVKKIEWCENGKDCFEYKVRKVAAFPFLVMSKIQRGFIRIGRTGVKNSASYYLKKLNLR